MRRNTFFVAGFLFFMISASSQVEAANCSCVQGGGTSLDASGIYNALAGQVVCAELISGSVTERWQERHTGNGSTGGSFAELGDGSGSTPAGTWVVNDGTTNPTTPASVTYIYTGGSSFKYEVCKQGQTVHFCGAQFGYRNITGASLSGAQCWQ